MMTVSQARRVALQSDKNVKTISISPYIAADEVFKCPSCRREIQPDQKACMFCKQKLK